MHLYSMPGDAHPAHPRALPSPSQTHVPTGWIASIDGLDMTVIAVDSIPVKPRRAREFGFYIGGRVDVVICADAAPGDYKLTFRSTLVGGWVGGDCDCFG